MSKLTAKHIQNASGVQLSKLLGKDPSTVSHLLKRPFNLGSLKPKYSCVDFDVLVAGLIKRREKYEETQAFQKEFDEILNCSEKNETPLSA